MQALIPGSYSTISAPKSLVDGVRRGGGYDYRTLPTVMIWVREDALARPRPFAASPTFFWATRPAGLAFAHRVAHEFGGGPKTQRRVLSGLRQIQTLPSGLGDASLKGTNSTPLMTHPKPVLAICSGDSQSYSPQHHSPAALR